MPDIVADAAVRINAIAVADSKQDDMKDSEVLTKSCEAESSLDECIQNLQSLLAANAGKSSC